MSAKNYDRHNRWRSKTIAFRMSPEEDQQLEAFVKISGLTKQDYITTRLLEESAARFRARGITLSWNTDVVEHLSQQGEVDMGARPLRRLIAAKIEDPAADLMLAGSLTSGQELRLEPDTDGVALRILP